jgi:hypothetical protein
LLVAVAAVSLYSSAEGLALAQCTGDCGVDGTVAVDELVTMVEISLGTQDLSRCTAGDENADGQITINELICAVGNALNGCPADAEARWGSFRWGAGRWTEKQ